MGLPTALQFTLEVGSFATLSLLISRLAEVEMASHQIALQVIDFSFLPAIAVAEAGSVLIGQAVGAGRDELVPKVARLAMGITAVYAGVWSVVLVVASPLVVSAFTSDRALVLTSVGLLHIAAVFQIFDAANIVARCALRGAGDVRFAAVVGVLTAWLCTPTLAWLLGRHYQLGARGGWIGLCLEIFRELVGALVEARAGWVAPLGETCSRELAARSDRPKNKFEGAPLISESHPRAGNSRGRGYAEAPVACRSADGVLGLDGRLGFFVWLGVRPLVLRGGLGDGGSWERRLAPERRRPRVSHAP